VKALREEMSVPTLSTNVDLLFESFLVGMTVFVNLRPVFLAVGTFPLTQAPGQYT